MITEQALNSEKIGSLHKTGRTKKRLDAARLESLRRRINDDNYLDAAIQRLALVMSNELMGTSKNVN